MKKIQTSKSHILKFEDHVLEEKQAEIQPSKQSELYLKYQQELKVKESDEIFVQFSSMKQVVDFFQHLNISYSIEQTYEDLYKQTRPIISSAFNTQKFHTLKQKLLKQWPSKFQSSFLMRVFQIAMQRDKNSVQTAIDFCFYIYQKNLSTKTCIRRAIDRLINNFNEILIDVPNFPNYMVQILASLYEFNILPEKYISRVPVSLIELLKCDNDDTLEKYFGVEMHFTLEKLSDLKKKISELLTAQLKEGSDKEQIIKLIDNKNSLKPIVLQKIVEKCYQITDDKDLNALYKLFCELIKEEVSVEQEQKQKLFKYSDLAYAFDYLIENIYSASLDNPKAKFILARFISKCTLDCVLPPRYLVQGEVFEIMSEDPSEMQILSEALSILKQKPVDSQSISLSLTD